jgi:glycosyltransferase involved in cell wall biosynthesis
VFVPRQCGDDYLKYVPGLKYIAYRRWHRSAYRVAERLHKQVKFDLAHQVTYATYREPGYMHRLGIPFVWGPIGGAQNYPWRFLRGSGMRTACAEITRTVCNQLQLYGSQHVHLAAKTAAAICASNLEMQHQFQKVLGVNSKLLCDVGTRSLPDELAPPRPAEGPIRIVWVGVLRGRKSLELLIEALALMPRGVPYEVRVVGDGALRQSWERLAERRGIAAHVHWLGQVPHDAVLQHFRWADVLAFTSLRDTSGTVILEAFAASKPVICLDHQGAGEIVTGECGIKIPVTNRRDVERRLRDAIVLLQRSRRHCQALGQAARKRAEEYLWSFQTRRIGQEYNRILESVGSDARCDFRDTAGSVLDVRYDNRFDAASARGGPPVHSQVADQLT